MSDPQILIADRISAAMSSMTTSEKRVARVLLARYPAIGLESVTAFAEQAEVSAPTVLRFITKLGFGGYPDFRRALREEIDDSRKFPLTRPRPTKIDVGSDFGNELLEVVRATLGEIEPAVVDEVIELLADDRRSVNVLGGDLTKTVAGHLLYHLRKMRRAVFQLPAVNQERADRLIDLGKKDIVILFDVRRYQDDVVTTARIASQRGCTVILFTDQWMSEAAEVATHVFRAKVETSSPWDSLLGLAAIVETLALALDRRLWSVVRPRLEAVERYKINLTSRNKSPAGDKDQRSDGPDTAVFESRSKKPAV
ncbi:MurR/RpiR family transcriptional regulator [Aminobacter anthyllidis]|uniref:MurR/RpiR family transcriptional regulator n=1 Tax=Aminobacter anthyllidis TaxID=1035067 RepID=A0A9X1AHR8_9HYPH|nr:MurR/RpiR family transcriptional regulator [Aminobacter anthyllidis]MBT1159881.1 MurR/RpiR family transcriptional regulator [Aminobacter anthyllidis]